MSQSHSEENWCIMADFKLLTAVIHKSQGRMAVARILQGLSCKVYSTTSPIFFLHLRNLF